MEAKFPLPAQATVKSSPFRWNVGRHTLSHGLVQDIFCCPCLLELALIFMAFYAHTFTTKCLESFDLFFLLRWRNYLCSWLGSWVNIYQRRLIDLEARLGFLSLDAVMVIYSRFDYTRLEKTLILVGCWPHETTMKWMTRLVTSLVTLMLLVTSRSQASYQIWRVIAAFLVGCPRSHNSESGESRT
jgi:hypothetical protein